MASHQQISSVIDIKKLGTILSVWAHPDDETFSCAGIMTAAVGNGQQVVCVTATKGEKGVQDADRWPPERLGDIRADELKQALMAFGINDHHWLDYPDGGCKDVPKDEAVSKIKALIDRYRPDTILTFGPEGLTGHDDHCTVSAWVTDAVSGTDIEVYHVVQVRSCYDAAMAADEKFNIFFNIDEPPVVDDERCDLLFKLPDELLSRKYQAMLAMPSQYEKMFNELGQEAVCDMICSEAFVRAR